MVCDWHTRDGVNGRWPRRRRRRARAARRRRRQAATRGDGSNLLSAAGRRPQHLRRPAVVCSGAAVCRLDTQLVRFSALATRALRPLRWLESTVLSRAQLQGRATNGAGIQPWRTMRSSIVAVRWSQIIAARPRWTQRRFGAERTGPFCEAACDRAWLARTSLVREPRWFPKLGGCRTSVVPEPGWLPAGSGLRER